MTNFNQLLEGYTFTRLKDRGVRNNIENYRKEVYLLKSKNTELVLIQLVDKKFTPLFQKNLEAYKLLTRNSCHPRLVNFSSKDMQILVTWEGNNLLEILKNGKTNRSFLNKYCNQAVEYIKTINKISGEYNIFTLPHYISRLIAVRDTLEKKHKILKECIDYLVELKNNINEKIIYGFGVSDPSVSNFVIDKYENVLLVDFDNFSVLQDYLYSVGWFVFDLQLVISQKIGKHLERKMLESLTYFEKFRFELGKLSRLAPPFLDEENHVKTEVLIDNIDSLFVSQVLKIKYCLSQANLESKST